VNFKNWYSVLWSIWRQNSLFWANFWWLSIK